MRLNELLVLMLELIARLAWPSLHERIARWATGLLPDLPRLEGDWVVHFDDPRKGGRRALAIDATLSQFGRHLRGRGHIQGAPADRFAFRGTIKRNVFYGHFAREDAQVLAGTGTFLLRVRADSKRLEGHCMWYDGRLEDVWVSLYRWRR